MKKSSYVLTRQDAIDGNIPEEYFCDMHTIFKDIAWIEKNFTEIHPSEQVVLDLKYSSEDNFMNENVYLDFHRCFLAPIAAEKFLGACEQLRTSYPDLQFRIWDTLRPRHIQAKFYQHLSGTPFQNYVAAPTPGSLHNFGLAMDLTLQKRTGELLDMGTDFDDFRDLAQPQKENEFLISGELTRAQLENRLILRGLMEKQGFKVLPHEWWHFNALPKDQVYGYFPALE